MTYRDANGNMSSTIVREENNGNFCWSCCKCKCNELVTQNSTLFKAMKQNRDYSYIFAKAETGKKYLLKEKIRWC
jgi:hypothetical protein